MREKSDALEILDKLRSELDVGRGIFAKKSDTALCLELCDRLARVLPESMSDAEYVNHKRKEILSNADVVAKNTIRAAEEKANNLVSESEIVRSSQMAANRIIESAYAKCDNLIIRTKAHLDNLFKQTENFLVSTLAVVRTNREELRTALISDAKDN